MAHLTFLLHQPTAWHAWCIYPRHGTSGRLRRAEDEQEFARSNAADEADSERDQNISPVTDSIPCPPRENVASRLIGPDLSPRSFQTGRILSSHLALPGTG